MKLKNTTCTGLVTAIMATAVMTTPTQAQSSDALMDALIRKGVLTEQEAEDIKSDIHSESKSEVKWAWKDGLSFQSADGKFKGKFGGRVQLDIGAFTEDDPLQDSRAGVEFRRARLYTEGTYASSLPIKYKFEMDFAGQKISFKDVYVELQEVPAVGSITVGHFKEPIGLETLTSSRFLTFIERALPLTAFAPERNVGIMIGNGYYEDRLTWALGLFTDAEGMDTDDEVIDSDYRVTGRVTGLPYYAEGGSKLVHLGISGSYVDPEGDASFAAQQPEAHIARAILPAPPMVETDHQVNFGAEAAAVYGPFSLQAEYLQNWVAGGPCYNGYYVYGSWFITGEHRNYNKSSASFDRLKPRQNFSIADPAPGAWELALRYSTVDYDTTGELEDITAGVNWYLNPNLKFQFNYIFARLDQAGTDSDLHGVVGRVHVDF